MLPRATLAVFFATSLLVPCSAFAQDLDVESGSESETLQPFAGGHLGDPSDTPWWQSFDDPTLGPLIEEALESNLDVEAAFARLDAANERVVQSRAGLMPTLSLDASISAQPSDAASFQMGGLPTSGVGLPGDSEATNDDGTEVIGNGSLMVNLRYPIDIWGRQIETLRASRSAADASADDLDGLAFTVAGRVGEAWFDVLMAREQLTLINGQIENQASLLELLEVRYRQGDAAASDVLQQRQQVASARANLPAARATQTRALRRLAVLLGRSSTRDLEDLHAGGTLPALPSPPATGRPFDLLDSRPDLRAARDRLTASQHQMRSSERSFLPALGLNGSAGGQLYLGDESDTMSTWSVGATLSFPIFRGLGDVASTREARAGVRESRSTLEGALLQAASDVDVALDAEREGEAQLEAHQRMVGAAREAYEVARRSYAQGIGNYLSVMTSLSSYQQAQLTVLQTRRSLLSARIQLHQALGGSWTRGLADRAERGRP